MPGYKPFSKRSSIPYFYQEWSQDSLAPTGLSISDFVGLHDEIINLQDHISEKPYDTNNVPVLLIQGGQDQVVNKNWSKNFYSSLAVGDKNIINYDDLDHFMLADGDWVDIISNDAIGWLNTHI